MPVHTVLMPMSVVRFAATGYRVAHYIVVMHSLVTKTATNTQRQRRPRRAGGITDSRHTQTVANNDRQLSKHGHDQHWRAAADSDGQRPTAIETRTRPTLAGGGRQ